MSKKIAVSLLLALTVTLTAQAQHKQSLMKRITEAAKETLNDMKQDTKPQAVHNQWDMYVIPHVGLAVSNITYSGDMHPGVRAGVDFEGVMLPRLSVTIGIDYLNQGAANVPYGGQKYDYSFGLIDTNLLAHWYPLHTKPLSVFAGVRATRVVSAKATLGGSHRHQRPDAFARPELPRGRYLRVGTVAGRPALRHSLQAYGTQREG